jgi:hypothetical protein
MMVNRSSLRDHTIVAPHFRTWMSLTYTGYVPTTTSNGTYFTVYGNSAYLPFSTSQPVTTTGLVTASGGSSIAIAPPGYTTLSALYGAYKILQSRIRVRFGPSSLVDETTVTLYPVAANDGNPALQPFSAASQPFARMRMAVAGASISQQTVTQVMKSNLALGLTRAQYDALPYTDFGSGPDSNATAWFWAVGWHLLTTSTNAAPIAVSVTLDFEIDLAYPRTQTN